MCDRGPVKIRATAVILVEPREPYATFEEYLDLRERAARGEVLREEFEGHITLLATWINKVTYLHARQAEEITITIGVASASRERRLRLFRERFLPGSPGRGRVIGSAGAVTVGCAVPGCARPPAPGRSLCAMHRQRQARHGSVSAVLGPRPWSAEDVEKLRALAPTSTIAELAELLGRSAEAVRSKARAAGVVLHRRRD